MIKLISDFLKSGLKRFDSVLALIYAELCQCCDDMLSDDSAILCKYCMRENAKAFKSSDANGYLSLSKKLVNNSNGIDSVVSFWNYDNLFGESYLEMKSSNRKKFWKQLKPLILENVTDIPFRNILKNDHSIVVSVPNRTDILKSKDFFPEKEVAEMIATQIGAEHCQSLLVRKYSFLQMKTLNQSQRASAAKKIFSIGKRVEFVDKPLNLIIIDDVSTTGNTVRRLNTLLRNQYPQIDYTLVITLFRVRRLSSAR